MVLPINLALPFLGYSKQMPLPIKKVERSHIRLSIHLSHLSLFVCLSVCSSSCLSVRLSFSTVTQNGHFGDRFVIAGRKPDGIEMTLEEFMDHFKVHQL